MKTGIAYFGVRNPDFVKVDLNLIASLSYTHILHTWSEEDLQYNHEIMNEIIAASNKFGLKVYVNPWGIGRVFGGEAYSELASRNPEWAQVDNQGNKLVASCPNHPGFVDYMKNWVEAVAKSGAETVFWDEPHFYFAKQNPKLWACTCDSCKKKFRQMYSHSMPKSPTQSVLDFRHQSMLEFLDILTSHASSLGLRNSVCLLPKHFNDGISDWESFAKLKYVDELGTDPYWKKGERSINVSQTYHDDSVLIKELCDQYGKEAQMWIKNYDIQKNNEETILSATWAAYNEGIRNIFAWSYKGGAYLSWLRSDDPEKVWELQCDAFLECHEKENKH